MFFSLLAHLLLLSEGLAARCAPLDLALGHLEPLELTEEERATLFVERELAEIFHFNEELPVHAPGVELEFAGEIHVVKKFLGSGHQGTVHLVEKDGEPFALKKYVELKFNGFYERTGELFTQTLPPWEIDHETSQVRLAYVDGITVHSIEQSRTVSSDLRDKVTEYFRVWQNHYGWIDSVNVVLDLDTGFIYVIDPV